MGKNFIIYQAGAGSGKTYQLAKRYIDFCLEFYDKKAYRNLLAITFTNKAVVEMKSRILLFLKELSEGTSKLLPDFAQKYGEAETKRRSKRILDEILHDYDHFSICTIDSFFQTITRSFAIELNLPINPKLELDDSIIIEQIIDLLVAQVGIDEQTTKIITNYISHNIDDSRSWNVEKQLKESAKDIYKENSIPSIKKLKNLNSEDFIEIHKRLGKKTNELENAIVDKAKTILNYYIENGIEKEDFSRGTIISQLEQIGKKPFDKIPDSTVYKYFVENEGDGYKGTTDEDKKMRIDNLRARASEDFVQMLADYKSYVSYSAIKRNIYNIALLGKIQSLSEQLKQNEQKIHISEANVKLAEVMENSPVNFVYEKIGQRYRYFLIDEFQDTSTLQWKNIKPLLLETLSYSIFDRPNTTGTAILFGDAKQAIYRFRGGDVKTIVQLSKLSEKSLDHGEESSLAENLEVIDLDTNYRSSKEIVAFNNTYFSRHKTNENKLIADIFATVEQKVSDKNKEETGCVSLRNITEKANDKVQLKKEVLHRIEKAIEDGYQYGDIAILTRENRLGVELINYLLQQPEPIPTLSNDALLLENSPEIHFLIAWLRYLENQDDAIAKAGIGHYIAQNKNLSLDDCLEQSKNSIENFVKGQGYAIDRSELARCELFERVENLISIFQLDKKNSPFVLAFLDFVAKFTNQNDYPHNRFLEFWEEKKEKESIATPEGINAVRVMSVHKSKGLEFPIVIYPIKEAKSDTHLEWFDIDAELDTAPLEVAQINKSPKLLHSSFKDQYEEEMALTDVDKANLEYVAFTRAKNRLHLINLGNKKHPLVDFVTQVHTDNKQQLKVEFKQESEDSFVFGEYRPPKKDTNKIEPSQCLSQSQSISFSATLSLSVQESTASTLWGLEVHDYLSKIVQQSDLERIIRQIEEAPDKEKTDKERIINILKNVFCPENTSLLFGSNQAKVKNEVEIICPDQHNIRIDRLILEEEKACIIDYKTGVFDQKHWQQITQYASIITQMGYKTTRQAIVYIHPDTSIEIVQ